ncbi:MAG: SCO1664 family protein [Chloroflexi bacterium]|nr:MAG: SCO1664 family protein [Chloroflexota bacterium]
MATLSNAWRPDDPWVEDALREATFGELRFIPYSSNDVYLARLSHPEHGAGLAVYKPREGENPLWDFPGGLDRREVAAYDFAQLLGWPIVPPTVLRADGPRGAGSLQLFIEHDPSQHYFELREGDAHDEALVRMAVFDLLANNADRKGGHVLLDPDGRLWGIDNGLCFHEDEKLRTVIWDYAGTRIPETWLESVACARDAIASGASDAERLLVPLTSAERRALIGRCAALLADPVLPEMYPWRCVPWPMV